MERLFFFGQRVVITLGIPAVVGLIISLIVDGFSWWLLPGMLVGCIVGGMICICLFPRWCVKYERQSQAEGGYLSL